MINCGEYLFESSKQLSVFDTGNFMCYALQGNTFQDVAIEEDPYINEISVWHDVFHLTNIWDTHQT